jgi:hypothetical protein
MCQVVVEAPAAQTASASCRASESIGANSLINLIS